MIKTRHTKDSYLESKSQSGSTGNAFLEIVLNALRQASLRDLFDRKVKFDFYYDNCPDDPSQYYCNRLDIQDTCGGFGDKDDVRRYVTAGKSVEQGDEIKRTESSEHGLGAMLATRELLTDKKDAVFNGEIEHPFRIYGPLYGNQSMGWDIYADWSGKDKTFDKSVRGVFSDLESGEIQDAIKFKNQIPGLRIEYQFPYIRDMEIRKIKGLDDDKVGDVTSWVLNELRKYGQNYYDTMFFKQNFDIEFSFSTPNGREKKYSLKEEIEKGSLFLPFLDIGDSNVIELAEVPTKENPQSGIFYTHSGTTKNYCFDVCFAHVPPADMSVDNPKLIFDKSKYTAELKERVTHGAKKKLPPSVSKWRENCSSDSTSNMHTEVYLDGVLVATAPGVIKKIYGAEKHHDFKKVYSGIRFKSKYKGKEYDFPSTTFEKISLKDDCLPSEVMEHILGEKTTLKEKIKQLSLSNFSAKLKHIPEADIQKLIVDNKETLFSGKTFRSQPPLPKSAYDEDGPLHGVSSFETKPWCLDFLIDDTWIDIKTGKVGMESLISYVGKYYMQLFNEDELVYVAESFGKGCQDYIDSINKFQRLAKSKLTIKLKTYKEWDTNVYNTIKLHAMQNDGYKFMDYTPPIK